MKLQLTLLLLMGVLCFAASFDWKRYYTFAEINDWLDSRLAANQMVLTNFTIGTSYEKRPIRAFRYSEKENNPAVFIEANMHGREWITSATATWLINELLTSTDANVRNMGNTIDWYIVPVANPDGFVFSHEANRLWTKNRRPNPGSKCIGTDLNKNFDYAWMKTGSSNNPCSDTFVGQNPFSEPETRAIRDFYSTIASRTRIFLSLHSFGQYILIPFGNTLAPSNNNDHLMAVAKAGADAISKTSNRNYVVGRGLLVLSDSSGTSRDWAFANYNTRLAFTFELRPNSGSLNGYMLPPNEIIPNNEEFVKAIVAMVAKARALKEL